MMEEFFLRWWPIALVLFQAALAWVIWSMRKQFLTHDDFDVYKAQHDEVHEGIGQQLVAGLQQFTRIEAELKHLPTRKDIEDLRSSVAAVDRGVVKLDGSIRVVAAKLGAVEKPVDMLMGHHLDEER